MAVRYPMPFIIFIGILKIKPDHCWGSFFLLSKCPVCEPAALRSARRPSLAIPCHVYFQN